MPSLDVFNQDAFGVISLSDAINKQPRFPQKISASGLFEEAGVTTTQIAVEELNGTLYLVPNTSRAGNPVQNVRDSRVMRPFIIPHLPIEDRIMADEIQDVRAFGSETETEVVQTIVNQRLAKMRMQLDMTLEWHRIGALKGVVYDSDGSTVIHNLFTEFGVSQETEIDFDLDNGSPASGAVRELCHQVKRTMRDNLNIGNAPFGVAAMCGSTFWDQLISHSEVLAAYERAILARETTAGTTGPGGFRRMGFVDGMFEYAGIMFWEYSDAMGSESDIATTATKAHFYPIGIPGLFVTRFAPANYIESVNTLGRPMYAKQAPDPRFNKFVDLEAQSNPINLCTRPLSLMVGRNT